MILLKDNTLYKCKYFYGTPDEWYSLILKECKKREKDIYVCDLQKLINKYPKKVKVIRTIDGLKRVLFLGENTTFIVQTDQITTKLVNKYLRDNVQGFYIFIPKYVMLEKFIFNSIYNPVRNEKRSWIYLK